MLLCFLQANCNLMCGPEYSAATKRSMALINEKETSFELVEALLKYIESLQVAGAVLIFLPGWNLIYSMQRHLETSPHFGKPLGNGRSQMLVGHVGSAVGHVRHVQPFLCSNLDASFEIFCQLTVFLLSTLVLSNLFSRK